MNVVLMCTGEIGLNSLKALISHRHFVNIIHVFTEEIEKPFHESHFDILNLAKKEGIDCSVYREAPREFWDENDIDFIIAIKWRLMINKEVLNKINKELIVFHASLLPQYRGFAPINWPIINGDSETGVTMFYGADEVDSGDIIDQRVIKISEVDTAATIDEKVMEGVVDMLNDNMEKLENNTANRIEQNHTEATYAIWRSPEDGLIDWGDSAYKIHNLIRGLTYPYPGAFTFLEGRKFYIWSAEIEKDKKKYVGLIPGKVESIHSEIGVNVLTGDGILTLKIVQLEGESKVLSSEIIKRLKTRLG